MDEKDLKEKAAAIDAADDRAADAPTVYAKASNTFIWLVGALVAAALVGVMVLG